ncbi:hypothetical protein N7467_002297 [Penicillium canescens]|nr:hypothetical protein N7467_002297 [Penicillium canescens]
MFPAFPPSFALLLLVRNWISMLLLPVHKYNFKHRLSGYISVSLVQHQLAVTESVQLRARMSMLVDPARPHPQALTLFACLLFGFWCIGTQPACCAEKCTDLNVDPSSCGACNRMCTGQSTACCAGACSDLMSDPTNCGGCNSPRCVGQQPVCCSGTCTDLAVSTINCGSCNNRTQTTAAHAQGNVTARNPPAAEEPAQISAPI